MKYTTEKTGKKLRDLGFEPIDKSWLWTLSEILDLLPRLIKTKDGEIYFLSLFKDIGNCYILSYSSIHKRLFTITHKIAVEAAAQLLIKLVEGGHIKKEN